MFVDAFSAMARRKVCQSFSVVLTALVSFAGCVVVPVAFYQAVVQPLLGSQRGVVYVLPEHRPWQQFWDEIRGHSL